jgi:hypothetical protein
MVVLRSSIRGASTGARRLKCRLQAAAAEQDRAGRRCLHLSVRTPQEVLPGMMDARGVCQLFDVGTGDPIRRPARRRLRSAVSYRPSRKTLSGGSSTSMSASSTPRRSILPNCLNCKGFLPVCCDSLLPVEVFRSNDQYDEHSIAGRAKRG